MRQRCEDSGTGGEDIELIRLRLMFFRFDVQVHRPLRSLLRSCVGDEPEEALDGQPRVVGAAGSAEKTRPSDYEKDRELHKPRRAIFAEMMTFIYVRMIRSSRAHVRHLPSLN